MGGWHAAVWNSRKIAHLCPRAPLGHTRTSPDVDRSMGASRSGKSAGERGCVSSCEEQDCALDTGGAP